MNPGGNSVWGEIQKVGNDVADRVMGPSADYYSQLQTPAQKGVGSDGDISQLVTNSFAVFDYVKQLTTGPKLGNAQFVQTAGLCKVGDQTIPRWTLVNNRVSGTDVLPTKLKNAIGGGAFDGLIPGMIGDVAAMNPITLLNGLLLDGVPKCKAYSCPVTDPAGFDKGIEVRFITPELELLEPEKNGCGWVGPVVEQALIEKEIEDKKAREEAAKQEKREEVAKQLPLSEKSKSGGGGAISGKIEKATGVSEKALVQQRQEQRAKQKACETCTESFWVPAPMSAGPVYMVQKPDYTQHILLGVAVVMLFGLAVHNMR